MSTKDAVLGSSAADISTGGPQATAVTSNAANKKILHQKRWVCDVCKVKWFLDFNEACAHEEQCKGVDSTASSSTATNVASKRAASNDKCAVVAKTSVTSAEMKDDGASPTITPPPQSKKAAAILAAARAKARGIPPVEQVDKVATKKKKSLDIEILSDSDDNNNAVNEVELVEGSPTDSNSRRKSKRLRDATPPAKSNHDSFSSNEMNGKKKKPKAVTAKTNKPTANKKSTSLKSKKTAEKKGGPIASIFLPKFQQQKQTQKKGDTNTNNNSKKRAVETNNGQSKKRNQRSTTSDKREVLELDSSSDDDDDEVVVVEKATKKKTKKNAVLGLSKEELREHQAADFFARRKKKAEEEKERQRKRDEARMARLNSKDVSVKSDVELIGDVKSSSVVSASSSKVTAAAADDTATKKISFLQSLSESSKHIKTIPAPKFPCPSHVVPSSDDSDAALKSSADATSSVLSKTPKYQHSKPSMAASFNRDDDATMPMGFLNKSELIDSGSSIFSSFFSCNAIKMINDDDESPASASQLWVDKYTMRNIPDDVIGKDNKDASKKLVDFVEEWKVRRHKAIQSMGQVKRKKKKRKKKKSSNGYNSDDSFLDDGGLENVFFISGPTASGKTRLVHAVAEQCECVVIEINTAEQRSGQALKRAVQETTQSHSSLAMSKRKQGAPGFFGNGGTDDLVDSDSDRCDNDSDDESKEDGHSLTIILIDEVDLLFDDDTAFWPALAQLSQKAKCPIVLTATSLPAQLYYNNIIRYKSIELRRPSPVECCDKIDQVRKSEGMTLRDGVNREVGGLSLIAETYECDLRKILNEMQMFRHETTQSGHSDIQQVNSAVSKRDTSGDNVNEDNPLILDIQPRILPRDRHAILTIKGRNLFQSELFIGGKFCKHFAVVSDSKVIAICPPCTFPEGVNRDAIYKDDQHIDCLSSKFAEVVLQKKCPSSGLKLDTKSNSYSGSSSRTNWNVEYDIPLRESKFDQQMSRQAFIRESKAKLKRQQNQNKSDDGFMSSDEEFEESDPSDEAPTKVEAMEEEQAEEEAQIEETDADAEALLNEALSNIDITPCSSSKEKMMASRELLQQNALDLSTFADELARFSDASLFESSFSLHVPPISGAVEGFGSNLYDSESSESDPTIDKLSKGKNNKPPCFDTIYQTGVNDSGFFFGNSDCYLCHPNRPRERQLLCLSEMNSRGLGRLDVIELKEEGVDADSNSGFDTAESDSMFPLMPTRSDSEDDILLSANVPSAFFSLPLLLMKRHDEGLNAKFTNHEPPLLDMRRNQTCRDSMYAMFEMLTNGKSWCFGLRHGSCQEEEITQQNTMTVAGGSLLDSQLALDYLPYLREISQYENKARFRVQEMMKRNGEADTGTRKTRSSRRNIRRHYLEEFYPGRFDGNIDAISTQLAQSYMS